MIKLKSISEFRVDAPLTDEQYKHIDDAVKIAARQAMIGRRLMPLYGPLGFGKQAVTYDSLTEVSDALIDLAWKVSFSEDIVNLARETLPVPVLHKSFRINRRSLEASRSSGAPIDVATAKSAAYKVAKLEDDLIIQGYAADGSNYDIKGLYQVNIANVITGSQWTAAPEDAIVDTAAGIAYLMGVNIGPPYHWVLNPAQYAELLSGGASTFTDSIIMDIVKRQLMGGDVFWTPALTAGTGFMVAAGDRGFFDLAVGVDITTEVEILGLDQGRDLFGVVYDCVVPRIWQSTAIAPFNTL